MNATATRDCYLTVVLIEGRKQRARVVSIHFFQSVCMCVVNWNFERRFRDLKRKACSEMLTRFSKICGSVGRESEG